MSTPLFVRFLSGARGAWRIERIDVVRGEGLPPAERLEVIEGREFGVAPDSGWLLQGVTSNTRYARRPEVAALAASQQGLGRRRATNAALIPIRKTEAWWSLAQDERRAIFEEESHHTAIGMEYLPAVSRRLHHCRELGEPFDFLTWFEYAPEDAEAFDILVARLRRSREWTYVDREIDIRLVRSLRD